uniref:Uncharacterized protein n=1 Tax=Setaria italica TaxID=4555 RepID=K3YN35_SETIT
MAAGGGEHQRHSKGRQRLLFVVEERRILDRGCDQYLVFMINLKDMFASAAGKDDDEDWAVAMRSLPRPVAQIDTLRGRHERLDLAAVSGAGGSTSIVVAVSCDGRTVIYDVAAAAGAPCGRELRYSMPGGTTLISSGTQLYAVPNHLWPPAGGDYAPSFQALQPPAQAGGGRDRRCWSWRELSCPQRPSPAGLAVELYGARLSGSLRHGAIQLPRLSGEEDRLPEPLTAVNAQSGAASAGSCGQKVPRVDGISNTVHPLVVASAPPALLPVARRRRAAILRGAATHTICRARWRTRWGSSPSAGAGSQQGRT